jgi:predicted Zn-dependent protease
MSRRALAWVVTLALIGCTEMGPPLPGLTWDVAIPNTGGLLFRWPTASLPVRFWVQQGDLPNAVFDAIAEWERNAPYGEFHGVITQDSTRADVIVRQGSTRAPIADASGAALFPNRACEALTSYYPHLPDSTLDPPFRTTIAAHTGYAPDEVRRCFAIVAVHTVGSTLGLLANSDNADDVMYGLPTVSRLSERDRATFLKLYHTTPTMRLSAKRR